MAYNLGAVKPHVAAAANHYGPKHGITVAYGYSPVGSVATSDHPKGLAVDFMTRDRARGDALAADVIATGKGAYNVTYVIWWRRIHSLDSRGWRPYFGPSSHTDHVHVSFGVQAGTGTDPDPVKNVGLPGVDSVKEILEVFKTINTSISWLTDAGNWARIGMFIVGFVLALIAVVKWETVVKGSQKVVKGVSNAKP